MERMSRLLHGRFAVALATAVSLAVACSDSPSEPRIPEEIEILSGEDQVGTVGAQLPDPIVVVVLDANGRPVRNQAVRFDVIGGGSLQEASTHPDAAGLAGALWTLGPIIDTEQRVDVHAVASPSSNTALASASVFATAGPAAAASLVIIEGSPQSNWEGAIVGGAPSVRVVDAFGNPVPGVPVTFVASGGGTVTNATVTSGALGVATVGSWRLGAVGTNTLTASSGTLTPVTFTAT